MSIQPLPQNVIAQIKSSTTITSLNGVVLELLRNSLDAGSTKVEIVVDYSRGGCVIEDNGLGILPSEFGENGGLGKLYRELFG
jgi:DNA mismatch repair protein MLH3